MKLLKKSALDVLMPQTSQIDNIISVCLLDIKDMAGNFLKETVTNKSKHWRLFLKRFQIQLQEKIKRPVKPYEHGIKSMNGSTGDKETMRRIEKFAVMHEQTQLTDVYLEKQQADFSPEIASNQDRTQVSVADFPPRDNLQLNQHSKTNALSGQSVLFVGGRAALYPEYHRLIASAGARLLIYRGSLINNLDRLYTLLENADMIICPIDCIDHNDFFAVKFYCRFSGKPHILLDRSNLATFSKGVKMLSRLACQNFYQTSGYN